MSSPSQDPGATPQSTHEAGPEVEKSPAKQEMAALGPAAEPISAAENPAPALPADSPAEALGRRTLSTAFVRVGPDGRLTVELRNGRVLALRDVVMHRKNYCGVHLSGARAGAEYCGGYAEVAAARPGGPPTPAQPDLAAPMALDSPGNPARKN